MDFSDIFGCCRTMKKGLTDSLRGAMLLFAASEADDIP
jgi:hypothetical protein